MIKLVQRSLPNRDITFLVLELRELLNTCALHSYFFFFLHSSVGGGSVCDRFFNSSATWAATFHLLGVQTTIACWLFFCFHNPPNRIFNVRTFLCVRIHTGVEHIDNESAQHFDSEKLLCSGRDSNLWSWNHWILRPTLYQLSHHVPIVTFSLLL